MCPPQLKPQTHRNVAIEMLPFASLAYPQNAIIAATQKTQLQPPWLGFVVGAALKLDEARVSLGHERT